MGCNQIFLSTHRLCNLTIPVLLLVISSTRLTFTAESRHFKIKTAFLEPITSPKKVSEEKAILRAIIGSRPPRCERRCSSCVHCDAIQVPANPQVKPRTRSRNSPTTVFTIAYSRGDDISNYKPMSWKCKCGNFIFNP